MTNHNRRMTCYSDGGQFRGALLQCPYHTATIKSIGVKDEKQ
jgi:hypothetical protein